MERWLYNTNLVYLESITSPWINTWENNNYKVKLVFYQKNRISKPLNSNLVNFEKIKQLNI